MLTLPQSNASVFLPRLLPTISLALSTHHSSPTHYLSPQNRGVTPYLKVCGHSPVSSCWGKAGFPMVLLCLLFFRTPAVCSAPSCLLGRSLQQLLPGRRSHQGAKSSRELPPGSHKQADERKEDCTKPCKHLWELSFFFFSWAYLIRQGTGCITHCSPLLSSEQLDPRSPRATPAVAQRVQLPAHHWCRSQLKICTISRHIMPGQHRLVGSNALFLCVEAAPLVLRADLLRSLFHLL